MGAGERRHGGRAGGSRRVRAGGLHGSRARGIALLPTCRGGRAGCMGAGSGARVTASAQGRAGGRHGGRARGETRGLHGSRTRGIEAARAGEVGKGLRVRGRGGRVFSLKGS